MGRVNISYATGQLGGTTQTNDGVVGMCLTGGIDGYTLGNPFLVTSLQSAKDAGVTEANSPFAYRQIKKFYDQAGDGAKLYLMLVNNSTTVAMMTDSESDNYIGKLLDYAQGEICVLGIATDDTDVYGGAVVVTNGLNADVYTAATAMATVVAAYEAKEKPFVGIVGGTSYSGVPGDLVNFQTTGTNNACAIFIGDTADAPGDATDQVAIGLLLGRISAIPVQRKIGRVLDGSLNLTTAPLLGPDTVVSRPDDAAVINGRGYMTWALYPQTANYFFGDDWMCVEPTDDFKSLTNRRVVQKARKLAYKTYVQQISNDVLINSDGTLAAATITTIENEVLRALDTAMIAKNECSGAEAYVDPAQVVTDDDTVDIVVGVIPKGYLRIINVKLGLTVNR